MRKIETKVLAREANLRGYDYRATVSKATGKLVRIQAGCRTWKTFDEAQAHYSGTIHPWDWRLLTSNDKAWAYKAEEARSILYKLRRDVAENAARIRNKKARVRKSA